MRHLFIGLMLLYSQAILKAQSSFNTTFFSTGKIGVFNTTKKAWMKYQFFSSGGVAIIEQYDSSDYRYFKTKKSPSRAALI